MEQNSPSICPNCFASTYKNGECSRCGYQAKFDRHINSRGLFAGTILKQRYYIGKILGEGGFGITYKVFDLQKRVICAVKEYAPNGMSQRSADKKRIELLSPDVENAYLAGLKRFLEESQILSRLEKIPSVVKIMDSFQENSTAYFVMEYLDGADLGRMVKRSKTPLPVGYVTNIILQVAVSMDVIHTKTKIIHRDISPDNIYITKNNQVKLIDFGSAKQTVTGAQDGFSVVVKLKLSPPEQYSQEMVQGSFTDVYSLAATYYYALTGITLPTAPDRLSGKNYVPLKALNLGIPDSVSDAVDQALILNVEQRTKTMQTFIQGIAPAAAFGKRKVVSSYEMEKLARQREEFRRQEEARKQKEKQKRPEPPSSPRGTVRTAEIPYIRIVGGIFAGKCWLIPPNRLLKIGRSSTDVDLRIEKLEKLSRIHCCITYVENKKVFRIRDVSSNGVFYGGRRLEKGKDYEFKPFSKIVLATTACIIEVGVKKNEHH